MKYSSSPPHLSLIWLRYAPSETWTGLDPARVRGETMSASRLWMIGAWGSILLTALSWARFGGIRDPFSPRVGNRQAILSELESLEEDKPVSFAVVGDSHGTATFNEVLEKLREEKLDFIVHLGDFAAAPSREGHAFFMEQVRKGLGPNSPPMLLVVGNHDVDRGFPVQAFEELYGPSSYSFRAGGNLFVLVRNCLPRSLRNGRGGGNGWADEVRRAIRENGYRARRTFVFMHAPPIDLLGPVDSIKAERFKRRWAGLEVDYVLAGHLHEYARTQIGRTVLLVSGGGGGRLKPVSTGNFFHALIIRVAGDQITEEVMAVRRPLAPWSRVHRAAVVGISSLLALVREDVGVGKRSSGGHGVNRAEVSSSVGRVSQSQ